MNQNIPELTGAGKAIIVGTGMSSGGGAWAWLGTHHQEIGAICAIVGATCAVVGLVFSIWRHK